MKPTTLLCATTLASMIGIGTAFGAVAVGDTLGTDAAEITAKLEAAGYAIKEYERENGMLEVEAELDGIVYEIEVDAKTGVVSEIEEDD